MSMGDLSVATGGLLNCKAKVQIGMLSSEMYKESTERLAWSHRYRNIQQWASVRQCQVEDKGFFKERGRGCSNAANGVSAVCPCACFTCVSPFPSLFCVDDSERYLVLFLSHWCCSVIYRGSYARIIAMWCLCF